jgi:hypothetical protein
VTFSRRSPQQARDRVGPGRRFVQAWPRVQVAPRVRVEHRHHGQQRVACATRSRAALSSPPRVCRIVDRCE